MRGIGVLGWVMGSLVAAAGVRAAPYRFELLSEGGVVTADRAQAAPALNDNGTAAFVLAGPAGSDGYALYVGTPGAIRPEPTGGVTVYGGVSINNHNRIAFVGLPAGLPNDARDAWSAFAVTPGGDPSVVISRVGQLGWMNPETGISDDGKVFATTSGANGLQDQAIVGDGTTTTRILSTLGFLGLPRMSSDGDYGYQFLGDSRGAPSSFRSSRFEVDASASYELPGGGRALFNRIGDGDVASNRQVVFNAYPHNFFQPDLFELQDGTIRLVPGSEGLGGTAAINDFGTVAVLHGSGLYVFHDSGPEQVLGAGDALLGSMVTDIVFAPKGFNNLEQFALLARLADGRRVYVLASPVPEPGGIVALVVGAGAVAVATRRRRSGRTP